MSHHLVSFPQMLEKADQNTQRNVYQIGFEFQVTHSNQRAKLRQGKLLINQTKNRLNQNSKVLVLRDLNIS